MVQWSGGGFIDVKLYFLGTDGKIDYNKKEIHMDIVVKNRQTVKRLKELTPVGPFLFAETMEDKVNLSDNTFNYPGKRTGIKSATR